MRINKFVAQATGMSRRAADAIIEAGMVLVNKRPVTSGQQVSTSDVVTLDGKLLHAHQKHQTILLNKPVGYVVSRKGQGSQTIYDLLPLELRHLKPVGRLDKDSSGLLLLTDDGELAHQLTHPKFQKTKVYEIRLDKPLTPKDQQIIQKGVMLEDGLSQLELKQLNDSGNDWQVAMTEGRNRQIRRTFAALDLTVVYLHRITFGEFHLKSLKPGDYKFTEA